MLYIIGLVLSSSAPLVSSNSFFRRGGGSSSNGCNSDGCGSLIIGQIADGQFRLGASQPAVQYSTVFISNGDVKDQNQRTCYITSETGQLQCSETPIQGAFTSYFEICSGNLAYNGSTQFYHCKGNTEEGDNIYIKDQNNGGCSTITLSLSESNNCPHSSIQATSTTPHPSQSSACVGKTIYPNLLIKVDSAQPEKHYGTGYNISLSATVSTIVSFDIEQGASGYCQLNFLLPFNPGSDTSAPFGYFATENGKISVYELEGSPNKDSTSYSNKPAHSEEVSSFSLTKGQTSYGYVFVCPIGQRVSYELVAQQGTVVEIFEDYNPPPIGVVINEC